MVYMGVEPGADESIELWRYPMQPSLFVESLLLMIPPQVH